jgi:hypothetical protein
MMVWFVYPLTTIVPNYSAFRKWNRRSLPWHFSVLADHAHRADGKRYVLRADELLTAFVELESAISACGDCKPAPQTVLNNQ